MGTDRNCYPTPQVSLRVVQSRTVSCFDGTSSGQGTYVSVTVTNVASSDTVSLSPGYFALTQSGIDYDDAACTFGQSDHCDSSVNLHQGASFTCSIIFPVVSNGSLRTLTFDQFGFPDIRGSTNF